MKRIRLAWMYGFIVAVAFAMPSPAQGQQGAYEFVEEAVYAQSPARGVYVGDSLVAVVEEALVELVDWSDPARPVTRGKIFSPLGIHQVTLSGHYAFALIGTAGDVVDSLIAFDVSDPSNPQRLSSVPTVYSDGEYPMLELGSYLITSGGAVIGISNPSHLERRSTLLRSYGHSYFANGRFLFIRGHDGIRVIDVRANPTNPVVVAMYPDSLIWKNSAYSIGVEDTVMYVAAYDSLLTFSVARPESPRHLASVASPWRQFGYRPDALMADGGRLYVYRSAMRESLPFVFDVSDPRAPVVLAVRYQGAPGRLLAARNGHVYTATGSVIRLDPTDPTNWNVMGTYVLPTFGANYEIESYGRYVYLANRSTFACETYHIDAPGEIRYVGYAWTPNGNVNQGPRLVQKGKYLYAVASLLYGTSLQGLGAAAVVAFDLSDPSQPTPVDTLYIPRRDRFDGVVSGVTRYGDTIYVAVQLGNLVAVDISRPTNMSLAWTAAERSDYEQLAATSDRLYARLSGYVTVYDISAASGPENLGERYLVFPREANWREQDSAGNIGVVDDHLVACGRNSGWVGVFDRLGRASSNGNWVPMDTSIASVKTGSQGLTGPIDVAGTIAYVSSASSIHAIDLSDPTRPVDVGFVDLSPMRIRQIHATGDSILVTAFTKLQGFVLYVFRLNPALPVVLSEFHVSREDRGVRARWSVHQEWGIRSYRVYRRTPETDASELVAEVRADRRPSYEVELGGPAPASEVVYVLTAVESNGEEVELGRRQTGVTPNGGTFLGEVFPNPFNPTTAIPVRMHEETTAELDIFDVAGRHVRTLHRGMLRAGRHRFVWDGRDDRGQRTGSGVYFVRLKTRAYVKTRKMVMLK